jgi:hypothetical protein
MRVFAILMLVLLGFWSANSTVRAEQSNDCKICGAQQRACVKNHSQTACKTEYEICMKHCRRK